MISVLIYGQKFACILKLFSLNQCIIKLWILKIISTIDCFLLWDYNHTVIIRYDLTRKGIGHILSNAFGVKMKKLLINAIATALILISSQADAWKMGGQEVTGQNILSCYHPTATFDSTDFNSMAIVAALEEAAKGRPFGQVRITTANIYFTGITGRKYKLTHAFDFRWEKNYDGLYDYWVRFPVLHETSAIPADSNCYLRNWVPLDF